MYHMLPWHHKTTTREACTLSSGSYEKGYWSNQEDIPPTTSVDYLVESYYVDPFPNNCTNQIPRSTVVSRDVKRWAIMFHNTPFVLLPTQLRPFTLEPQHVQETSHKKQPRAFHHVIPMGLHISIVTDVQPFILSVLESIKYLGVPAMDVEPARQLTPATVIQVSLEVNVKISSSLSLVMA